MTCRRLRGTTAIAAVGVLLLTAACGGDTDEAAAPASTPTATEDSTAPGGSGTPDATASPTTAPQPALAAPALAADAEELARRLVAAEDTVRAPATSHDLRQAAFETQVLYRQLARTPHWHEDVLAAVGGYRETVADHIEARTSLRSVLTQLSGEVPAWRIVAPTPIADLRTYYREGERTHGVAWEVLAAINFVETGFAKIRGYSTAGARGPMQFIASTWAAYGEGDIDDPRDAILAAARYLAANGGDTTAGLDGALHAYNRHTGYVRGVRAYVRILQRDPGALAGLHRWQIVYLSERGDLWLPQGYRQRTSLPVNDYLTRHPDRLLSPATD